MPKARKRAPDAIQPYIFHGIDLNWQDGDKEALAGCPFCIDGGKFSADLRTGKWRCWKCDETGNAYTFLRKFWTACDKQTTDYREFLLDRKLQHPDTLMAWGVVRSITTGNWLVPGYDAKGELQQLYQRKQILSRGTWRWVTIPTPRVGHAKANKEGHRLHGVNLYDKDKSIVYLCEGPWDGMALWELLRQAKHSSTADTSLESSLVPTANVDRSLLGDANVLAVPGCNVFLQSWLPLFAGKTVNLMYDNDHPRKHPKTDKIIPPAGLRSMQRVARTLSNTKKHKPAEINYLRWGEKHGYNLDLPSGHDVRDHLNA